MELLREQEHELTGQIQKLERIKGMVQPRLEHTAQGICIGKERIWTADCPEENIFLGPALPEDCELLDGWNCLPAFYEACIEQNIPIGLTVGSLVEYDEGAGKLSDKPARYFCRLPKGQYPDFHTKPAGKYAIGTKYMGYGGNTAVLYRQIFDYIEEHGLTVCGNAYEEFLIDEIGEKDISRYMLQTAIQVKDNK